MATLGQQIGKVKHSFSTTNSANETVQITAWFDFTNASDSDVKMWLVGNRTIALQRPLKALSGVEIKALDGITLAAEHCGKKIEGPSQKVERAKKLLAELRALGVEITE